MPRARFLLRFLPIAAVLSGSRPDVSQADPFTRAAWLTGCWEMTRGETVVEEQWMPPRGDAMLEMGRTVRGGRLVDFELVVLRNENGRLAYEAHPSGQPTATFREREKPESAPSGELLFEDPTHDFPQRVGYRRLSADSAIGWIEGSREGRVRRIDFRYARVGCGGSQ